MKIYMTKDRIILQTFDSWEEVCDFIHICYDQFKPNEPLSNHRKAKLKKKIKDAAEDGRQYCGYKWYIEE